MWIVPTLKDFLDFPRPAEVFGVQAIAILGNTEVHHSLPSGHAAFAVLLAASLTPGMAAGWRWSLVVFAVLVCLSRVVVGAHFPADVMAGALIALGGERAVRALLGVFSSGKTRG
jgi:membrane-associated phospholipid phosphatase